MTLLSKRLFHFLYDYLEIDDGIHVILLENSHQIFEIAGIF